MKSSVTTIVLAAVLTSSAHSAGSSPSKGTPTAPADPRLRTLSYQADAVVDVPVKFGLITHVVLGDDEIITSTPVTGKGADCNQESHTWCVVHEGRNLFIKAKTGATTNNLIVLTSRRRHVFTLTPIANNRTAGLMRLTISAPPPPPAVVPVAGATKPVALPLTAKQLIAIRSQTKPLVRNSNYSVATGERAEDIVPTMVFDDGTQTYFKFPNNLPLPTVFQTSADGTEEMVNARMDEDLLVADRVTRRFVLRQGNSVVAIINEAFDPDGVTPVAGTTISGVARVLRADAVGP